MTTTTACNMFTNMEFDLLCNEITLGNNLQQSFNIWKDCLRELYRFVTWEQTTKVTVDLVQDYSYNGFDGVRVANLFFYIQGGEIMAVNLPMFTTGIPPQFSIVTYDIHQLDRRVQTYIEALNPYLLLAEPALQICQITDLQSTLDSKEDTSIVISNYTDINSAVNSHINSYVHATQCEYDRWNSNYEKCTANVELAFIDHVHCNYINCAYSLVFIGSEVIDSSTTSRLEFCSTPSVLVEFNDLTKTLKFSRL